MPTWLGQKLGQEAKPSRLCQKRGQEGKPIPTLLGQKLGQEGKPSLWPTTSAFVPFLQPHPLL